MNICFCFTWLQNGRVCIYLQCRCLIVKSGSVWQQFSTHSTPLFADKTMLESNNTWYDSYFVPIPHAFLQKKTNKSHPLPHAFLQKNQQKSPITTCTFGCFNDFWQFQWHKQTYKEKQTLVKYIIDFIHSKAVIVFESTNKQHPKDVLFSSLHEPWNLRL